MNIKAKFYSQTYLFTLIILSTALGYALYNIFYAFHPTDDGFILGYAWRIIHGEIPYRDFIYVRTPLSPYIACLWFLFPKSWQFLIARASFYLWISIAVITVGLIALKIEKKSLQKTEFLYFIFMAVSFMIWAIHNFPPMSWHTVDGVLLSSVGISLFVWSLYLLFQSKVHKIKYFIIRITSGLLCGAAYLAKQNYVPILVFFGLLIWIEFFILFKKDKRFAILNFSISLISLIFLTILFIFYLELSNGIGYMIAQLMRASKINLLFEVGFNYYFQKSNLFNLGILMGAFAGFSPFFYRFVHKRPNRIVLTLSAVIIIATPIFIAIMSYKYVTTGNLGLAYPVFWWIVTSFVIGQILSLDKIKENIYKIIFGIGLIIIVWSSSISWGYYFPFIGMCIGFIIIFWTIRPLLEIIKSKRLISIMVITISILSSIVVIYCMGRMNYLHPYKDESRNMLTANIAEIFPKFGHLYSNERHKRKLNNLKLLAKECGAFSENRNKIVMIPNHGIWYFLTDTRNPVSLDWITPAEYQIFHDRLILELKTKAKIAIIEKESTDENSACVRPGAVPNWIIKHWKLKTRIHCFFAYENPEKL